MRQIKQTKYMELFTLFGYLIGFGLIIIYVLWQNYWFMIAGVVAMFVLRGLGYILDRLEENSKTPKKKNKK